MGHEEQKLALSQLKTSFHFHRKVNWLYFDQDNVIKTWNNFNLSDYNVPTSGEIFFH